MKPGSLPQVTARYDITLDDARMQNPKKQSAEIELAHNLFYLFVCM